LTDDLIFNADGGPRYALDDDPHAFYLRTTRRAPKERLPMRSFKM
jgi:hypothetical protein